MTFDSQKAYSRSALADWAARHRKPVSVTVAAVCLVILLISKQSWPEHGLIDLFVESGGFLLIVIAVLGRIWCALYISGNKNNKLVTQGPYSLVRNPLYVFSFIGALGIGLASENVLVTGLLLSMFLMYYPLVVAAEEYHLYGTFGQAYVEYAARTPRFIPDRIYVSEPNRYSVKARSFRASIMDSMYFFLGYMILQVIEKIHLIGWLPVSIPIP